MPRKQRPEQDQLVTAMLRQGTTQKSIAQRAHCSERQVQRIKQSLLRHGTVRKPKNPRQGRKCLLNDIQEDVQPLQLRSACTRTNPCRSSSIISIYALPSTSTKWFISSGMHSILWSLNPLSSASSNVASGATRRHVIPVNSHELSDVYIGTKDCCGAQHRAQGGLDTQIGRVRGLTAPLCGRICRQRTYSGQKVWMGSARSHSSRHTTSQAL